jgi:hypothetical protein
MYCTNCGDKLSATARFCTGCGVSVTDRDVGPVVSPEPPLPEPAATNGDRSEQERVCVTGTCEARGIPTARTRCDLCGAATQSLGSSKPAAPSSPGLPAETVDDKPRVGGWGLVIFLFGFVGGAIGWLSLKGRDPRRADHVLKWSLIFSLGSVAAWLLFWLILIAILAHAASSASSSSLSDYTTTDSSALFTQTTTASVTPAPLGESVFDGTVTGQTADGYSASADVVVYRPRHVDKLPALPLSGRSALASCAVDGTRDAAVPISVEVTNTTKGFATPIQFNMTADASAYSGASTVSIEGDLQLSDGTYCDGPQTRSDGDVYSVIWNDPVAQDGTVRGDFFLIIHDFYSPNDPGGDLSLLDSVELVPTFGFGPSGSETTAPADNNVPID